MKKKQKDHFKNFLFINTYEMPKAFGWYARSYKLETIDSKDSLQQLEASKLSIKVLFKDFFDENKDSGYQITVKVLLWKEKQNGDIEFALIYVNSTTKTVINIKYVLNKSFEEVLHRINSWINEGSGWIIEILKTEYVSISVYSPLSGSTYIKLARELKNLMRILINIKTFKWKIFKSNENPSRKNNKSRKKHG